MADESATIALRGDELAAYRAAVVVCALPDERECCERLLGQLASVEAREAMPSARLEFAPGRRTARLAHRALAMLRDERVRRRGDPGDERG
jgi:hypothetical protein